MTQDSSINNISLEDTPVKEKFFSKAMLHNMKSGIRDGSKLSLVMLVLHMVSLPLVLVMMIIGLYTEGLSFCNSFEAYPIIAMIATISAIICGILCALGTMPYLYKKSVVDMRLSLPLTTAQRYVSDFLAGFITYAAPFIISQVFSWIILGIGHVMCDGREFPNSRTSDLTGMCYAFEEMAPYLLKADIAAIPLMLMFFTLTVLVASCCGSYFESLMYTFLANGLIPGTIAIVIACGTRNVTGLIPEGYMLRAIPYTSPIGGAIGVVYSMMYETGDITMTDNPDIGVPYLNFRVILAVIMLVTAVMAAGAYFLYKKRKAEDTGKPIVFDAFYHIIMIMAIVCVNSAFLYDGDRELILPMIIITAIMYMIFTMIRNRGAKEGKLRIIGKNIISYLLTMGISIAAFALITSTELFGAGHRVPTPEDVKSADITYFGYYNKNINRYPDTSPYITLTDPENIKAVCSAHSKTLEYIDSADEWDGTDIDIAAFYDGGLSVRYTLKNGETIERQYSMKYAGVLEILSSIDLTEEGRRIRGDIIKEDVSSYKKNIAEYRSNDPGYIAAAWISPQWRYNADEGESINLNKLPADFAERFADCLARDIMNETEQEYFSCDCESYYLGGIVFDYYGVNFREHHKETIAYLKSVGFETLPELSDETVKNLNDQSMTYIRSTHLDEYISGQQRRPVTPYYGGMVLDPVTHQKIDTEVLVGRRYDELAEILKVSRKQYKTDEAVYTITVNGNVAVIPSDYSEIAEELYILSVCDEFGAWIASTPEDFMSMLPDFSGYEEYLADSLSVYLSDTQLAEFSSNVYSGEVYEQHIYRDGEYEKVTVDTAMPENLGIDIPAHNDYMLVKYTRFIEAFVEYYGEDRITEVYGNKSAAEAMKLLING